MKPMNKFHALLVLAALMLQLAACQQGRQRVSHSAGDDSIYTKEYMVSIHMQEPYRALEIIDTIEARRLMPQYMVHYMRALVYQNALEQRRLTLYHIMQATDDPRFEAENPNTCCTAYAVMVEETNRTNNFTDCLNWAKRGLELAKRAGLKLQELNFTFYIGRSMMGIGNKDEGLRLLRQVIHEDSVLYAKPQNIFETDHVVYVSGELMGLYRQHGMLAEAQALVPHMEHTLELLDQCDQYSERMRNKRKMEIYSTIMRVYDQVGQYDRSERYMQKMLSLEFNTLISLSGAASHYLASKRYPQLLSTLEQADHLFHTQYDSISNEYLSDVLQPLMQAYVALGRERDARITAQRIVVLTDSLNRRAKEGDAAQLSKIYETQEKERMLKEQDRQLAEQRSYLLTSFIFLALALAFVGVMIYYNRRINRQSKATVRAIRQLIEPAEKENAESATQVMEDMRLRQAAQLFRSNPQLEVSEVASRCGFDDLAAFQRFFMRHFGLHPAEYRKWSLHLKREDDSQKSDAARQSEEANSRLKTTFLQNMSHEIRTPLNQISGFVQLLTDPDMSMDEGEKRQINGIIAEQTQHMTRMLNTFIEMSEYEGSDAELPAEELSIDTLLEEVCDTAPRPQEGVTMSSVNRSGQQTLSVNAQGLRRLLACLMNNAVKFTAQGTIELACYRDEATGRLCFSVTDTGRGIPEGEEEKIFDNFYKVDEYVPGVGLGLSLSRRIAQRLGATLELDRSYTAQGSRFVLTLG